MATPVDLFESVVARLRSDATCTGLLTGGIRAGFTPPGTALPYASLIDVGEDNAYMTPNATGTPSLVEGMIQVSCFALGRSAARACGKAVRERLTSAPLAYSDGSHMTIYQTSNVCDQDPELTVGGMACWHDARTFAYTFSQ